MSQTDLARELGTSQNAIYRVENPKYGKHSVSTLKKIADYFDVGLIVRFAPFSEIAGWTIGMSEQSIDVPDFEHDSGFVERTPQDSATVLVPSPQSLLEETQKDPDPDKVVRIDRGPQSLANQSERAIACYVQ